MGGPGESVESYLEKAVRARTDAGKATDPNVKIELLKLAIAFERLAERQKRAERKKPRDR